MKSNRFFDDIQKTKFDFVKHAPKFALISLIIAVAGIFVMIFAGLNLGLDFTGGTIVKVQFGHELEVEGNFAKYELELREIFDVHGIRIGQVQQEDTGDKASISLRFQDLAGLSEDEMSKLVKNTIIPEIETKYSTATNPNFNVFESGRIGATASSELVYTALIAILVSAVLILIYIAIRFELLSGLSTLIGIIHDVLIVFAIVAIFRIEVNSAFIAAIITVIGYSINNTIIVFDRIRENERLEKVAKEGTKHIVNVSIKQTLIRSIYTTATTLIAVLALAIIGVPSIRVFLLPIIIGMIAGAYSSIFLSAPLWGWLLGRAKAKGNTRYVGFKGEKKEKVAKEKTSDKELARLAKEQNQ